MEKGAQNRETARRMVGKKEARRLGRGDIFHSFPKPARVLISRDHASDLLDNPNRKPEFWLPVSTAHVRKFIKSVSGSLESLFQVRKVFL